MAWWGQSGIFGRLCLFARDQGGGAGVERRHAGAFPDRSGQAGAGDQNGFPGLAEARDRMDVIAYLAQFDAKGRGK
jgi:hypothetical protein